MFQNFLRISVARCLAVGRKILPLLEGDSRLAGPAATLRAAQNALQAKHDVHQVAVDRTRLAHAKRHDIKSKLGDVVREFALVVLALTRNDFEAKLFRRYFRTNYGEVMKLEAGEMAGFGEQLQLKLAEETDPKLVAFAEPIRTLRGELVAAESEYNTSAEAEANAFLLAEAQKLDWIQGLTVSRLQATQILYQDKTEIRRLYHAAAPRTSAGSHEPESPEGSAESPAPAPPAADGGATPESHGETA